MAASVGDLRAKAAAHQAHLDRNTKFFKPKDLKDRWGVSLSTIRAIPYSELPWHSAGVGIVRETRRYHPDKVLAYEAARAERRAA